MKKIYSLIAILMMSLVFVGCDKKPERQKPTPGGKENPTPNPDPTPDPTPEGKSELPLLSFTENEEEIQKYETELGRQPGKVNYVTNQFDGYTNEKFSVIPAVAYGLTYSDGTDAILALGIEKIDNPTKTLAMLKEAGFTVESGDMDDGTGKKIPIYKGKNQDDIKVMITPLEETQFETNIQIIFTKMPQMDFNKNAKDFPSYEALASKKFETVDKFEQELGLREADKTHKLWDESKNNLYYAAKAEKLEAKETNIGWACYVGTPSSGPSFINNEVKGIKGAHLQSDEVKEWFALNGFSTEPQYEQGFFYVYNSDKTIMAQIFSDSQAVFLQIYNPAEPTTTPAKMKAMAKKMMAAEKMNGITPKLYQK